MASFLTFAAAVVAIYLLLTSIGAIARSSQSTATSRGTWGIAAWSSARNRPLNPQERRWQTLILAAKENPGRWRDFAAEVEGLERANGVVQHSPAPDRVDLGWVADRIDALEAHSQTDPVGESPR